MMGSVLPLERAILLSKNRKNFQKEKIVDSLFDINIFKLFCSQHWICMCEFRGPDICSDTKINQIDLCQISMSDMGKQLQDG
jgi:hypothetical protein